MNWNNRNQEQDSNYSTVLLSLLAGAGAGLAVGLLMAPKSGANLRADIRGAIDEQLDTARHKADDLKNSAVNFTQRGLKEIQKTKDNAAQRVKSAVDSGAKQAHGAVDEAAGAARSAARKTHDAIDDAAGAVRTESAA